MQTKGGQLWELAGRTWRNLPWSWRSAKKVQSVNRFVIGAIITGAPVVSVIRRELRQLAAGLKVENGEIEEILRSEVIKREVIEGEAATKARAQIKKALKVQRKPRPLEAVAATPAN